MSSSPRGQDGTRARWRLPEADRPPTSALQPDGRDDSSPGFHGSHHGNSVFASSNSLTEFEVRRLGASGAYTPEASLTAIIATKRRCLTPGVAPPRKRNNSHATAFLRLRGNQVPRRFYALRPTPEEHTKLSLSYLFSRRRGGGYPLPVQYENIMCIATYRVSLLGLWDFRS